MERKAKVSDALLMGGFAEGFNEGRLGSDKYVVRFTKGGKVVSDVVLEHHEIFRRVAQWLSAVTMDDADKGIEITISPQEKEALSAADENDSNVIDAEVVEEE